MPPKLLSRLREVGCDRQPFTPEHATCVCRLTNDAADEIERLLAALAEIELRTFPYRQDQEWPLVSGIHAVAHEAQKKR